MDRILFVYLDWTLEDSPRCFYVGKGNENRIKKRDRNEYWKRVAAKYGWRREKILSTRDPVFAYDQEIEWIAKMGTYHYDRNDGWGCNFTRGGDGGPVRTGWHHTAEIKDLLRQKSLGNRNCVGRKASAETLAKRSGKNHHFYGKQLSPEHVEKNRVANCGENNAQAKLDWPRVRDIRARFASGATTKLGLAKEFDVSRTLIHYIVIGRLWKERTDDHQVR